MTLPNDITRCRDDKCPQRWECARWAPPWEGHDGSGVRSYVGTMRGEDGVCEYSIIPDYQVKVSE